MTVVETPEMNCRTNHVFFKDPFVDFCAAHVTIEIICSVGSSHGPESRKSLHSFAKPLILHRVRTYFTRSRCCVDIWLHEIRGPNVPTQSWLFKKRPGGFSAPANSPKEAATERLIAQFSPPPSYFPDLNFFMGANRTSDERKGGGT